LVLLLFCSHYFQQEDDIVVSIASNVGSSKPNWCKIARFVNDQSHAGRTGKQCRERYLNHLRPNIKKGGWTKEEETMIRYYHKMFGKKWSAMAQIMKNRTDNDIKNKFYSMNRSDKRKQERSPKTETFETSFQSNGQSGDAQCQPSPDQEKLVFDFIPAFELPSLQLKSLQWTEPLFARDSLLHGMHSSIMHSNSMTPQPHQCHGDTAGDPYGAMDWQGYPPGPEPIHVWGNEMQV
jgi:Myb-like DNA-binding domain